MIFLSVLGIMLLGIIMLRSMAERVAWLTYEHQYKVWVVRQELDPICESKYRWVCEKCQQILHDEILSPRWYLKDQLNSIGQPLTHGCGGKITSRLFAIIPLKEKEDPPVMPSCFLYRPRYRAQWVKHLREQELLALYEEAFDTRITQLTRGE